MATNVFSDPTKKLPTNEAQIVRVAFDQFEIGARKSHLPKALGKNNNNLQHVK
jgi:hypothetical protein